MTLIYLTGNDLATVQPDWQKEPRTESILSNSFYYITSFPDRIFGFEATNGKHCAVVELFD